MKRDPCRFFGDWTDDERQAILDTLLAHVPRKVDDVYFMVWNFDKFQITGHTVGFQAARDNGAVWLEATSAEQLADELDTFYRS